MDSLPALLRTLAANELERLTRSLPSDPTRRLVVLVEATRVVDYNTILDVVLPFSRRLSPPDLNLMQSGWGPLAAHGLSPLAQAGAFPMMESTEATRRDVMGLLHRFGQCVHLKRVADMVECGLMTADVSGSRMELRRASHTHSEFVDLLDHSRLHRFEEVLRERQASSYNGWTLLEHAELDDAPKGVGAFLSRASDGLAAWHRKDVNTLMVPLIRPWDSGRGVMMAYDALPEVDDHFMATALEFVVDCRNECGFHPSTKIPGVDAAELTAIVAVVVGLHMKHVRFALLAMQHHKTISIPQSLTIWTPERQLAEGIAEWTRLPVDRVTAAMRAFTAGATDAPFFLQHGMPQMPLLLSLDNGMVVRPVSSIARNPLIVTLNLLLYRHSSVQNKLMDPREDWLRSELYATFGGTRYIQVDGNVTLREGSRVLTDIDAAIYDRTSGDLALFQLKWQDYFTNDVRRLRSRAKNLTVELDTWGERVGSWLHRRSEAEIFATFRLGTAQNGGIRSVSLFGLSRNMARVSGLGFRAKCPYVAVANWAQFLRLRRDIGPVDSVFPRLHEAVRAESWQVATCRPLPVEWTFDTWTIHLSDLWNAIVEDGDTEIPELPRGWRG